MTAISELPNSCKRPVVLLDLFKRFIYFGKKSPRVPMAKVATPSSQVFSIPDPADAISDSFYDKFKVKRRLFEGSGYHAHKKQRRISSTSTDTSNEEVDVAEIHRLIAKEESRLSKIDGYLTRIDYEKEMWLRKQRKFQRRISKLRCKLKKNITDDECVSQSRQVGAEEEYDFETEALDDTESD